MRKFTLFLITAFLAFSYNGWGQTTIWSEDFNTPADDGVGATGLITPGTNNGVTAPSSGKWSVDVTNCNLGADSDWFRVESSLLEARDVDGTQQAGGSGDGALWTSESITISGYTNVSIAVDFSGYGTFEDLDFIKASYQIDGGSVTQFAFFNDDFSDQNVSVSGLSGNALVIYLEADNNSGTEYLRFDNVIVEGVAAGSVSNPTSFAFEYITSTKTSLTWTAPSGTYDKVLIFGRQGSTVDHSPSGAGSGYSDANAAWGSAGDYDNSKLLYAGTGTGFTITGLTEGNTYYFKAYAYDDSDWSSGTSDINDQVEVQGTSSFAASAGDTEVDLSWTNYSGAQPTWWTEVLILAKSGSVVDETPSGDGSAYTANAAFSSGTEIGTGNYVVYKGTGTSQTVTGLTNGTAYHFRTFVRYESDWTDVDEYEDANATPAEIPELLFTEVMQNPSDVGDSDGEWFEIYNYGSTTVDINGYVIKDAGTESHTIDNGGSLNISAGSFLVLGNNSITTTNGGAPVDYQYSGIYLGNSDDELILYITDGTTEVDRIEWDGGSTWPDPTGESMTYTGTSSEDNNVGSKWIEALRRENNYTNPGGGEIDKGSPDKNGYGQDLVTSSTWTGTGNWSEGNLVGATNWSNGVPGTTTNTTINGDVTVVNSVSCNNLTIESSSSGDGSLLGQGNLTASGTVTAQRYISNGQWHGVSSPLDGATAQSLYSSTANVYLKEHSESTNAYTNITSLGTDLGDMKGLMMWYAGASGETFDITGTLRTGTVGSADNLVRTIDGNANGWNFMGNPFPSAIDWDAGTGWLKTNVGISVYLYNNGTWNSWNGSTGTGMTSGNIAMGQGFFVEVIDGQTTGTLTMTDAVQVHNNVGFLKSKSAIEELIRLEVSNGTNTDETVVYFDNDATSGYDYQFDAHKLFSFDQDRPQIYSTANDNMSINVLPDENTDVPFDVKGLDGENMTIAATEVVGFGNLMLLDNATGSQTNLVMENYEFTYSEDISDRFLLFFTTVNTEEELESNCEIYSFDRNIRVILHNQRDAEIVIYNLMGQKINQTTAQSDITDITMYETGCYVVKVISHNNVETSKVIIR